MSNRPRNIILFLTLWVNLFTGACSFKKDTAKPDSSGAPILQTEIQKQRFFCDNTKISGEISRSNILTLSSSSQPQDICEVWGYLSNLKTEDRVDSDLQIFENFTSSINAYLKKEKTDFSFEKLSKSITNLSIKLKGSSVKNVILLNNKTNNFENNILLLDYAKDDLDMLFIESNEMSLNQFNDYWKKIESRVNKSEICNEQVIEKILKRKTISPHLISIATACNRSFSPFEIVKARKSLNLKVSDFELRFFQNSIKAKAFVTNPIEEPIFASTVITSISKADPNLFRLAKTIKRPGDKGLHLFAFSVQSNVNIEPLLESLKDEDFTDLFHWEEIQATSSIPSFGVLLLILNKYNIFPSEECTREILDGIKKSRSPQHGSLSNNTNTLNLYKFLSSTTSTGYFRISSEMNLEDNELQLLVSKQTDDPSVFEFVAHQKINDATFNVNIGASGTLFISQKDAGTGFDGLFIDGDILLQLVKHDLILSQDANLIFYRLSSGEKLFVSVKDFTEALQKDSDLDSIQIQCRSGKMINSCTELLEKNKELMKAAVKALAMHFLKK